MLGGAPLAHGSNLCATLWAQSLLQDLRIADGHMMHVNHLWETRGASAGGCLSAAMLGVSVYIRRCGDHQMCCTCHSSKSKCGNYFVVTLQAEIDRSLSPALTGCKWIRFKPNHTLWPFAHKKTPNAVSLSWPTFHEHNMSVCGLCETAATQM